MNIKKEDDRYDFEFTHLEKMKDHTGVERDFKFEFFGCDKDTAIPECLISSDVGGEYTEFHGNYYLDCAKEILIEKLKAEDVRLPEL